MGSCSTTARRQPEVKAMSESQPQAFQDKSRVEPKSWFDHITFLWVRKAEKALFELPDLGFVLLFEACETN